MKGKTSENYLEPLQVESERHKVISDFSKFHRFLMLYL